MPEVRQATADDISSMRTVHRTAIERNGRAAYTERQIAAWRAEAVPSEYPVGRERSVILVVEESDDVVAMGQANFDGPEIDKLFVHPEVTGQGIGRRLLDNLETRLREQGAEQAYLDSSLNAVTFYHANGYRYDRVIIKHLPKDSGSVVYPTIRMNKSFRTDAGQSG